MFGWLKRKKRIRWNPMIQGFPRELGYEMWFMPSDLIGRGFNSFGIRYRVTDWTPAQGSDCLAEDGVMTATEVR